MSLIKRVFICLFILMIAAGIIYAKNLDTSGNKSVNVFFYEPVFEKYETSNLEQDYSVYWEMRQNGIGSLKMVVKFIPNIDSSKDSFFLGYKAEIKLNIQAEKLEEQENENEYGASSGQYEVRFWFDLLDEDGFCLSSFHKDQKELSMYYTNSFLNLAPGDGSQIEQAIIFKELSSHLVSRVKNIRIGVYMKKIKQ